MDRHICVGSLLMPRVSLLWVCACSLPSHLAPPPTTCVHTPLSRTPSHPFPQQHVVFPLTGLDLGPHLLTTPSSTTTTSTDATAAAAVAAVAAAGEGMVVDRGGEEVEPAHQEEEKGEGAAEGEEEEEEEEEEEGKEKEQSFLLLRSPTAAMPAAAGAGKGEDAVPSAGDGGEEEGEVAAVASAPPEPIYDLYGVVNHMGGYVCTDGVREGKGWRDGRMDGCIGMWIQTKATDLFRVDRQAGTCSQQNTQQ